MAVLSRLMSFRLAKAVWSITGGYHLEWRLILYCLGDEYMTQGKWTLTIFYPTFYIWCLWHYGESWSFVDVPMAATREDAKFLSSSVKHHQRISPVVEVDPLLFGWQVYGPGQMNPNRHWLESLLGFIRQLAQTLTRGSWESWQKKECKCFRYQCGSLDLPVGWLSKGLIVARGLMGWSLQG